MWFYHGEREQGDELDEAACVDGALPRVDVEEFEARTPDWEDSECGVGERNVADVEAAEMGTAVFLAPFSHQTLRQGGDVGRGGRSSSSSSSGGGGGGGSGW